MGFSKHRTPMVSGMSFRRCLSGGGDIFSKSVERQGGANRTFKASGCCHGWQLEPCPYGIEPLLTFRQKIPTGRPHIEEGHSVRRGRSWICLTNSQVTENKTIHKHLSTLYPVVKMHKNNVADLTTIYKLPINYRKSLATDS